MPIPDEPDEDGAKRLVIGVLVGAALILVAVSAWLYLGSTPVVVNQPVQPAAGQGHQPLGSDQEVSTRPNEPPTAVIRLQADANDPYRFQYSGIFSEDRDHEDVDRLSYRWDFGDGTVVEGGIGEHVYDEGGEVTVTLTVTDTMGAEGASTRDLSLPPLPAIAPSRQRDPSDQIGLLCYRAQGQTERFSIWDQLWVGTEPVVVTAVNLDQVNAIKPSNEWFGLSFRGGLVVDRPGVWQLHLTSDDGSRLELGGVELIRMERGQSATREMARVRLEPGVYDLRIDYWNGHSGWDLAFEWRGPDEVGRSPVPTSALVHRAED